MRELFKKMLKYAGVSYVGTVVDFALFRFAFYYWFPLFYAELFASFIGMIINFFLQKKYVFNPNRNTYIAFALSILSSFIVMSLGALLITQLIKLPLFEKFISLAKIGVIGFKFLINFFTKRWIFEKRF